MKSFEERWGQLTIDEVIELNNKAKESCEIDG